MDSNRYERQMLIKQIGEEGQKKLSNSTVGIVGAGGLGSPILYYLAAAGVGNLRIVDFDTLDISNLNRQILHNENRIGQNKAESAYQTLRELNSAINILHLGKKISESNIEEVFSGCDLLIDAVDNIETRLLINKFSIETKIPAIFGAVEGYEGYFYFYNPKSEEAPCYTCYFPNSINAEKKKIPIIGATAGVIGAWQASESIKYLTGQKMENQLVSIDLKNNYIQKIPLKKRLDCPECGEGERK
jgi:adenylyltransferase/sulfurtransferase